MTTDARPPLFARLRPGYWIAFDVAAAVVVAAVWSAPLVTGRGDGPPDVRFHAGVGLLGATALAVPLAVRRWRPLWAFALALPAFGLSLATSVVPVVPLASVPMAAVAYSLAAQRPRRVAYAALGAVVVLVLLATSVCSGHWAWPGVTVLLPGAVVVIGWSSGVMVAQRRAYAEALRRDFDNRVHRAVTGERLQIARELHDVVAHSMSVITIQADMGRLVLDRKPAVAGAALGVIETTGREALAELRRMLGVLREDDRDRGALAPVPGLAGLDDLVTRTAAAGIAVEVGIRGTPRALAAGVDLSAYRIVQEALTNVVKHAGVPGCRLTIEYEDDAVLLVISDRGRGGPPEPGGHGLVGMRERALLCGGEFDAGPAPGGGFAVTARLPDRDGR
ncbi:sensor histidine kinase [Amycolatopsis sp. cmx-4-68]|uniref:sensor histidine kinase n=1 Tax=Amycolatopsis sp. cmx-4-68 TaxID=2790938 RepID=UPI00397BFBAA